MSEGRAILERLAEKGTSVGPDAVLSAAVAEAERRLTGAQPSREQRSRGPRLLVAGALVVVAALITTLVVRTDDDPRRPIRIEPAVTTTAPVSAEMPRRILVSTSNNGVVVLDSTSGEIVQSLTEPGDDAWGADEIEIDPTGDRWYYASLRRGGGEGPQCDTMRRIASMGFDGSPGEQVAVGSRILISPDGRYLAYRISGGTGTECSGEEARVLDVTTGDEARYAPRTDGQGRWVVPEAFTPDSKGLWVWSAPWTGSVGSDALIDPATGEQLEAVDSDDLAEVLGAVEAVRPLRDGGFVVFDARGEGPGTVAKVSAGQDRDRHALFTTPAGSFPELESVDPSGRHVLVTYYNGILHRWSEGDESPLRLLGNVLDAEWIPDDVELPDVSPSTTDPAAATTPTTATDPASTDPPSTIVAVVDGDVVEMDASDGSVLRTVVAADEEVHATSVLVDRPRGRVFLLGDGGCDGEGNETVWQVPIDGGGDPVRVTEAFEPSVSSDGKWLAAPRHEDGCAAGALVLHEIESGGERIWRDAPGEYLHAEWAPDGRRLAVGVYAGGGGAPDGEIRVVDTQNRYATYADMPVLTRGFLRDSVVVDGRWILAVILRCDHEEDQECRDEVVTVDGDTGEQIDSFGEWLWTEDVDLDATGRHALVFAPESTESAYGRTVMYAVEPGGESRRIGPATDADW